MLGVERRVSKIKSRQEGFFVVVSCAQTFIVFDPINLVKFISIVNTVHHVEKDKENV